MKCVSGLVRVSHTRPGRFRCSGRNDVPDSLTPPRYHVHRPTRTDTRPGPTLLHALQHAQVAHRRHMQWRQTLVGPLALMRPRQMNGSRTTHARLLSSRSYQPSPRAPFSSPSWMTQPSPGTLGHPAGPLTLVTFGFVGGVRQPTVTNRAYLNVFCFRQAQVSAAKMLSRLRAGRTAATKHQNLQGASTRGAHEL